MPADTTPPTAVIFDLGGTLVHWPDWDDAAPLRWGESYDQLVRALPRETWPSRDAYVLTMREAELAHWRRVDAEHWSGPPSGVVAEGFRLLERHGDETELLAALDAYAAAVDGWANLDPDARETLATLRARSYRLGLLSNTWWAAAWHDADLATHGLAEFFDELVYTSDLPHSKPHLSVFLEVAERLGADPAACVMIGDRMVDDVGGALTAGMRGVWRRNDSHWPPGEGITPSAVVTRLSELPPLLQGWGGR